MNKQFLLIIGIVFLSIQLLAQKTIKIAENTFNVTENGGEQIFYYGFAKGDRITFNFEEVNGKKLKEIEITELPASSIFMDYNTKKIKNKILTIQSTGIYKFRFSNANLSSRTCTLKIEREPVSDSTRSFNSTVYWNAVEDTTYSSKLEKYLAKNDTIAQEIYSSSPQISSNYALNGNKNFQIVDFNLPKNTVSWSFYIGTGREGKTEYEKTKSSFVRNAASLVSKIPEYGPLAALALTGVSYFSQVQGEDNVKYWFLKDANSAKLFNTDKKYSYYKMGDVINEASQMKSPLSGKVYLALQNDNTIDPIVVTIKVLAIQVNQQWGKRVKKEMKICTRQEPYLKND